jgi:hypothetical protein
VPVSRASTPSINGRDQDLIIEHCVDNPVLESRNQIDSGFVSLGLVFGDRIGSRRTEDRPEGLFDRAVELLAKTGLSFVVPVDALAQIIPAPAVMRRFMFGGAPPDAAAFP